MSGFSKLTEKMLAHFFCFFFVAQILSPMIGDKTIYIDVLLVVTNPFFLLWISRHKVSIDYIYVMFFLALIIVFGHPATSVKLVVTFIEVAYLFYLYERRLWYVNRYIFVSIFIAVIQLYGVLFAPQISFVLSPGSISSMVWGPYATMTYSNFYSLFEDGIPHVSGLSREAGFMASLLLVGICIEYLFSSEGYWTTSRLAKIFYAIGYVISFTKMSLLIIPVYIVYSIRRVINVLPFYVIPVLWTFGMMVFWSFYQDILLDPSNLTFLHRFGSYVSLWNLDVNELFFGVDNIAKISSFVAHTMSYDYEYFGGFGGWLIMNGLLSAVLYFLILHRLHITSVGVLLFLLLSVNVQVDTNQNFIILAYFILFKYCRSGANDKTFNVLKN